MNRVSIWVQSAIQNSSKELLAWLEPLRKKEPKLFWTEVNSFIQNILKETLLLQLLLIMSLLKWLFIRNKSSVQFWSAVMPILYRKLLTSLIQTNGEMELLFSLNLDLLLENSKIKSKLDKSVSTSQFQSLSRCSHLQEARSHSTEIWTFTERTESNSSLNGRP